MKHCREHQDTTPFFVYAVDQKRYMYIPLKSLYNAVSEGKSKVSQVSKALSL